MKLFCQCASVFPVGREGHGRGYHLCVRTRVLPRQTMPPRMPIWQMVPLVRTHDGTSLPTLPFWKPYQAESCGPAYARWNLPASAPAFPKKASPEVANPGCVYAQPGPAARRQGGFSPGPSATVLALLHGLVVLGHAHAIHDANDARINQSHAAEDHRHPRHGKRR